MTLTIPEFYSGKHLFLTGGTGFIGKVLIEKLLRSCPDIGCIFCLVRPKKGQPGQERLEDMFKAPMYDKLRSEQPSFSEKVKAIHGDLMSDGLGIKNEDKTLLEENIDIVIHSAATIRFDEPLRIAVEMNILGVRKMVKLSSGFKNLEVFVHVSTAYANCDQQYIEETVYPPPVEPQKLIDILDWMDDDMIASVTPKLIGDKPNTYTYTKQIAENLLIKEGAHLPLAIVRPSIVTAAWKEPVPGWLDNMNGPSGLYVAAGKGLLRSFLCDSRVIADIIPVDLPVNMTIAAAWHTVVNKPKENALVYHTTTGNLNPFTWGEMESNVTNYFKKYPMQACFRRPKQRILTESGFIHDCWILISHLVPAYAADLGYIMLGKKPRMVKIYKKLHKGMEVLEFFTRTSWDWTHAHMDMLKSVMSPDDQKTFYLDPRSIHWPSYIENYCLGTKRFMLKEPASGLPAARAHVKMLRNIRYTFNTMMLILLWRLLVAKSSLARSSWYFVMGLVFKFVQFFRITSTIRS